MPAYRCSAEGFAITPQEIEAANSTAAALKFARKRLPSPDPWGQSRAVTYAINVERGRYIRRILVSAAFTVSWELGCHSCGLDPCECEPDAKLLAEGG